MHCGYIDMSRPITISTHGKKFMLGSSWKKLQEVQFMSCIDKSFDT